MPERLIVAGVTSEQQTQVVVTHGQFLGIRGWQQLRIGNRQPIGSLGVGNQSEPVASPRLIDATGQNAVDVGRRLGQIGKRPCGLQHLDELARSPQLLRDRMPLLDRLARQSEQTNQHRKRARVGIACCVTKLRQVRCRRVSADQVQQRSGHSEDRRVDNSRLRVEILPVCSDQGQPPEHASGHRTGSRLHRHERSLTAHLPRRQTRKLLHINSTAPCPVSSDVLDIDGYRCVSGRAEVRLDTGEVRRAQTRQRRLDPR
jgi:hypothetical protein